MKKIITAITGLVLLSFSASAQIYSTIGQFQSAQLYYNPAAAGVSTSLRANVIYRNQWNRFPGAPKTFLGTLDAPLGKNLGGGIVVYNHSIGKLVDNSINLNASYRLKVNEDSYFQFGLKGGATFVNNTDLSDLAWQQGDEYLTSNAKNGTIIRVGVGGFYKRKNFFAGISSPDVASLDPQKLYYDETSKKSLLKRNIIFIAGTKKNLSEFIAFQPNIMVKSYGAQSISYYLNLGFEFNQTFTAGLSISKPYGYGIYTRVAVSPKLKLGFRYDLVAKPFNTQAFKDTNFGSTEIMLSYGFNN